MVKLVLGVIDIPYRDPQPAPKKARKDGKPSKARRKSAASNKTTGDVAEILESEYGVIGHFFEAHKQDIAREFEEAVAGALDNVLNGLPVAKDMFAPATDEIGDMMKTFLSSGEAERVGIAGTPTMAALKGVNHRFKHPYAKANPRRPSFIDTDQYRASMKAWTKD